MGHLLELRDLVLGGDEADGSASGDQWRCIDYIFGVLVGIDECIFFLRFVVDLEEVPLLPAMREEV